MSRGAFRDRRRRSPSCAACVRSLDAGTDLPAALGDGRPAPCRATCATRSTALLHRLSGDYHEDEWGFDEEFADVVYAAASSCSTTAGGGSRPVGVRNVPAHGRALLVANHAGRAALGRHDDGRGDAARAPAAALPALPRAGLGVLACRGCRCGMRKLGGVVASPYNALRLLEQDELVAVFPEGAKGAGKPFSRALPAAALRPRRLRRARPAHRRADRAGGRRRQRGDLPEAGRRPACSRADRRALLPDHPDLPVARPARRWCRCRRSGGSSSASRSTSAHYGPEAAEDRALVFELSEQIRETIQAKVYDNLVARGSAFV